MQAPDLTLWDTKTLAQQTGIPVRTLMEWRTARRKKDEAGPPFVRVGSMVRYRVSDVMAWLTSRTDTGAA